MKTATRRSGTQTSSLPKLDLGREFKADYVTPRKPVLLEIRPARYLVVDGEGRPGSAMFEVRIGALYSIAFTVKMTRKFSGERDYTVHKLEARYLNMDRNSMPPPDKWRWQLLIRTPEFVTADDLASAVAALRKRGKQGDAALVRLETIDEGRCVQMLHVGPYDQECDTVASMCALAKANGLEPSGPHHEIYISDPRRVPPAKLKTILRIPVA